MKNRSHLPEILLHLLIVMVLPLAAIIAVSKAVEIAGIKPDWCDAVVLLMKTAVMVNVAIHPLPSKYNTAPGEPIILFPANAPLGYKKPSEHDADEYDEGEPIPETEQEAPSKEPEAEHADNDADEQ